MYAIFKIIALFTFLTFKMSWVKKNRPLPTRYHCLEKSGSVGSSKRSLFFLFFTTCCSAHKTWIMSEDTHAHTHAHKFQSLRSNPQMLWCHYKCSNFRKCCNVPHTGDVEKHGPSCVQKVITRKERQRCEANLIYFIPETQRESGYCTAGQSRHL